MGLPCKFQVHLREHAGSEGVLDLFGPVVQCLINPIRIPQPHPSQELWLRNSAKLCHSWTACGDWVGMTNTAAVAQRQQSVYTDHNKLSLSNKWERYAFFSRNANAWSFLRK